MNKRICWTKRRRDRGSERQNQICGTKEGKNRERETRKWEKGKEGNREEQIDRDQINNGNNRLRKR